MESGQVGAKLVRICHYVTDFCPNTAGCTAKRENVVPYPSVKTLTSHHGPKAHRTFCDQLVTSKKYIKSINSIFNIFHSFDSVDQRLADVRTAE